MGSVHETKADAQPVAHTAEVHQTIAEALRAQAPSEVHQTIAEAIKGGVVGHVQQTFSQDDSTQPPVISSASAIQRDTAASFLVDVEAVVYHPPGGDVKIEPVEWQIGGVDGAWNPATPQPFDRKHDSGFQSGIPVVAPGKAINFVWQPFFDLPEGTFDDVFVRVTVENNPTATTIVGPITISTVEPSDADANFAKALARRAIIDRTPTDFLGNGLLIPFRRGSRDFVSGRDVELIRSTVRQILGTRAAVGRFMGDLPWRPDFGNKLWILRHRNNDTTLQGQASAYVLEALRWEPRVEVTRVEVLPFPEAPLNELRILVRYQIISEDTDDNRVFLPEFEEIISIAA